MNSQQQEILFTQKAILAEAKCAESLLNTIGDSGNVEFMEASDTAAVACIALGMVRRVTDYANKAVAELVAQGG